MARQEKWWLDPTKQPPMSQPLSIEASNPIRPKKVNQAKNPIRWKQGLSLRGLRHNILRVVHLGLFVN